MLWETKVLLSSSRGSCQVKHWLPYSFADKASCNSWEPNWLQNPIISGLTLLGMMTTKPIILTACISASQRFQFIPCYPEVDLLLPSVLGTHLEILSSRNHAFSGGQKKVIHSLGVLWMNSVKIPHFFWSFQVFWVGTAWFVSKERGVLACLSVLAK